MITTAVESSTAFKPDVQYGWIMPDAKMLRRERIFDAVGAPLLLVWEFFKVYVLRRSWTY